MRSRSSSHFQATIDAAARDALGSILIRGKGGCEYLFHIEHTVTGNTARLSLKGMNAFDVIDFVVQLKHFCPVAHYVTYQRADADLKPDDTVLF